MILEHETLEAQLYSRLRGLAHAGLPMLTNGELGVQLRQPKSGHKIRNILLSLEAQRRIEIQSRGSKCRRVKVEGKWTDWQSSGQSSRASRSVAVRALQKRRADAAAVAEQHPAIESWVEQHGGQSVTVTRYAAGRAVGAMLATDRILPAGRKRAAG